MNNLDNTSRIEAYLMNNMTSADRDKFEAEINDNKGLAEEIRLFTLESAALRLLEKKELRGKFEDWKVEKQQVQPQEATIRSLKTSNYIRILSVAASFLLLIIAGVRWSNVNYSNEAIADGLFQDTTKRSSANDDNPFTEATAAIAAKDYTQALSVLDKFQNTNLSEKATFIKAGIYYRQEDYKNAETTYLSIIDNPNGQATLQNDAKMYLAAVYLKQGKEKEATNLLNALASSNNNRKEDATKMLKQYNSFWHRLTW